MNAPRNEVIAMHEGREIFRSRLADGEYVIGCSDEADLKFAAEGVSRRHARLFLREDGGAIEDIGSRNGTQIGGASIEGLVPMLPEQPVKIGSLTLELRRIAAGAEEMEADESHLEDSPGSSARRYEIGPLVAKGGMGAVHSAHDLSIRRRVAMKVMLRAGDAAGTARFLEEAQITGQLEHPNIVPIHELGFDAEGHPFYTMKFVRGTTLRAILEALASGVAGTVAKYPLPMLLTIFQKVCDALAFAHSRQVIHRDLKPDNIMLGDFGEVLVMDWGIAKLLGRADHSQSEDADALRSVRRDDPDARTLDGSVMGTAFYMSPEQAMGEVSLLDARSDIYSLGAILYEILALHPPVEGARVEEILGKVRKGEIVPMREGGLHLPGGRIPDSLRAVCLQALALSPERRYQEVTDLQADIRAYENGFATSAENASAWKTLTLFVRRNKTLTLGVVAVLVSLVAGLFSTLIQRARAEDEADKARAQAKETDVQRSRAEKEAEHARESSTEAQKNAREAVIQAKRAESEAEKAREQTREAKAANARNVKFLHEASMADYAVAANLIEKEGKWAEGVVHLARALDLEDGNRSAAARLYATLSFFIPEKPCWPYAILTHKSDYYDSGPQFSPDGTRILTVNPDGNAYAWDAATGQPLGVMLRQVGTRGTNLSAQFSRDGSRIVTTSGGRKVQVWNAATGALLVEMLHDPNSSRSVQLSPDGKSIIKVGDEVVSQSRVKSAQFSPDGSRIVTVTNHNTFCVWDVATGKMLLKIGYTYPIDTAQFSPDGSRILAAISNRNQPVLAWDAATGKALGELLRQTGEVNSLQFSPDGSRIVTSSKDKTAQVWDAVTGKAMGEPLRHADSVSSAQFSPDGSRILTASWDKTVQVWDAVTGKAMGEPLRHADSVSSAQFSPDGTRIVTASGQNNPLLWAVPTGKALGEPLRHTGEVTSAQFSSDGKRILTASKDKTAQVWDAVTGKALGKPILHEGSWRSAQFSPDGSCIVTVSKDERTVQVWDAFTGRSLGKPLVHESDVRSVQLSPDGLRIVTASGEIAQVWNVAAGLKVPGEPLRHTSVVNSARFSPDGSRILTGSADNSARVWDSATGKAMAGPLRTSSAGSYSFFPKGRMGESAPKGNPGFVAEYSFDGSRIVAAGDCDYATVWDAATGKGLGGILNKRGVESAQFSPDGARILTANRDNTAQVWDAFSGKALGEPLRHAGAVLNGAFRAKFSPDGALVATASDEIVRVWDVATGKTLGEPLRHTGGVNSVQFSPDSARIVTAGKDNTARVWDAAALIEAPVPVPAWVGKRVRGLVGYEFDAEGELQTISAARQVAILSEEVPGEDAWARLMRWAAKPPADRTLTPNSRFTARQIAERERDTLLKEGLESALRYDPTTPLARLLLAGVLQRDDALKKPDERDPTLPQRAAFLRDYDLARMPNDTALWERAVRALHDQQDDNRALRALARLDKLAPAQAVTLRSELKLIALPK